MVSWPFTLIDPARLPTSPRTDLRVVVRPAPLRPRSVTTSPRRTARSTPCSTCDSPYQALRPEMPRTSSAMDRHGAGVLGCGAHVRLDHLRVRRNLRISAFRQHGAALHHRD